MKKLLIVLTISGIILSCSKDEETVIPDTIEDITTQIPISQTDTTENDTIIPFSLVNCCDTNFTYIGQIDSTIEFIPTVITPNGDWTNDDFGVIFNTTTIQSYTFELRDSLGTLVYSKPNFFGTVNGNTFFSGRSLNLGPKRYGMYSAKLYSATGSILFKLCIVDANCPTCLSTCAAIDDKYLDPSI